MCCNAYYIDKVNDWNGRDMTVVAVGSVDSCSWSISYSSDKILFSMFPDPLTRHARAIAIC